MKVIATNRKAYHDFFVLDTYEAGIVLVGSEVKSIRLGNVNLKDSYVTFSRDGEVFVKNMFVKTYDKTTSFVLDERRDRKLLLNKAEASKIFSKVKEKGNTIVPLSIYFKGQHVKLEIALAKGKHTYDKKDVLKDKDTFRELQRDLKNY